MRILGIDHGLRITGFSSDITWMRKLVCTETRHLYFSLECSTWQ